MKFVHGKLFQNISTKKVQSLRYNPSDNYYELICKAKQLGLRQAIITSDIMLQISEKLLVRYDYKIVCISFMVDDSELQSEIDALLKAQEKSKIYWTLLKQRLQYFSENDSIDIKRIEFSSTDGLFSVQVNGIFSTPESLYDSFSEQLADIVEGCIQ